MLLLDGMKGHKYLHLQGKLYLCSCQVISKLLLYKLYNNGCTMFPKCIGFPHTIYYIIFTITLSRAISFSFLPISTCIIVKKALQMSALSVNVSSPFSSTKNS